MAGLEAAQMQFSRSNEFDSKGEERIYRFFRQCWHPVIYSHELAERPKQIFLCGEQLVVVRLGGEVCAFADLCAHRGAPLSLGTIENGELRCAYHGWQYDVNGHCTFVPQNPGLACKLHARIKKYQAAEKYGMVWVCLVDKPVFPLPEFPQYDDPKVGLVKVFNPTIDWNCSAPRRTENYVDLGHFACLHDGFLGLRSRPAAPEHRVWREEPGVLRMELKAPNVVPNNQRYASLNFGPDEVLRTHRQWWIFMPLTVLVQETGPGPNNFFYLLFHPTPIGPTRIRNFTCSARNYGTDNASMDELVRFNDLIYEQDRPIVEGQRPQQLSEDLSQELHMKGVDTLSLQYRKWLMELVKRLEGNRGDRP